MNPLTLVLIHGAGDTSRVWRQVQSHLRTRSVALDLLGRGDRPADLAALRRSTVVERAARDVRLEGVTDLVLVAHSLGAALTPDLVRRLGDRVRHAVHIAGLCAPEGAAPVSMPWSRRPGRRLRRAPGRRTPPASRRRRSSSAQGARKAALVYVAADSSRSEIQQKQRPQMEAAGIAVVHEAAVPLSTLSYDSVARGIANSGADYLLFVGDPGQSASLARSLADIRYELRFQEHLVAYGSAFIELAGDAAEGAVSWTRTLPSEEPGVTPEHAAYLTWMDRTAPDTATDTFAADSWAATKALVDALAALPGSISREALLRQLRSTETYDAGGMLGTVDFGAQRNRGCVIAMHVAGGRWKRLTPSSGFLC